MTLFVKKDPLLTLEEPIVEQENELKRNTENQRNKDFSKNSVQKQKQQTKSEKKLKKYFDITASKYLIPTNQVKTRNSKWNTVNWKS